MDGPRHVVIGLTGGLGVGEREENMKPWFGCVSIAGTREAGWIEELCHLSQSRLPPGPHFSHLGSKGVQLKTSKDL